LRGWVEGWAWRSLRFKTGRVGGICVICVICGQTGRVGGICVYLRYLRFNWAGGSAFSWAGGGSSI
jgi:hypothetical protein